jgi:hypothetical protein
VFKGMQEQMARALERSGSSGVSPIGATADIAA